MSHFVTNRLIVEKISFCRLANARGPGCLMVQWTNWPAIRTAVTVLLRRPTLGQAHLTVRDMRDVDYGLLRECGAKVGAGCCLTRRGSKTALIGNAFISLLQQLNSSVKTIRFGERG